LCEKQELLCKTAEALDLMEEQDPARAKKDPGGKGHAERNVGSPE
jgi:hypothetical protein